MGAEAGDVGRSRSRDRGDARGRERRDARDRSRDRSRGRDRRRSGSRERRRRSKRKRRRRRRSRSSSTDSRSTSSDSRSRDRRRRRRRRSRSRSRSRSPPRASAEDRAKREAAEAQMRQQMAIAQRWVDSRAQTGPASRKQREVYVGNLAMGVVTEAMLAEVFDSALESLSPDDARPPVVGVQISPDGAYAFAEMRTEALSDAAMHLDGVELCGRAMRVGRPKGWIDPRGDKGEAPKDRRRTGDAADANGANPADGADGADGAVDAVDAFDTVDHYRAAAVSAAAAAVSAASSSSSRHPPTPLGAPYPMPPPPRRCVLLDDAVAAADLADASEREAFREEVREECARCGVLEGVLVPTPPPWASASAESSGRAYAKFQESFAARAAREMLHGRAFDGRTVSAWLVSDEEFRAVEKGAWPPKRAPPGAPSRCGILRARNLPREATKADVANFFRGCGVDPSGVRLILAGSAGVGTNHGETQTPGVGSGEAFVEIVGAEADVDEALARAGAALGGRPVEIHRSSLEEVRRTALMGRTMI